MERSDKINNTDVNKTSDAVSLMNRWYGGDAKWDQMVFEEEVKARVGQIIYNLRMEANLSQAKLAKMIHKTQAMVSRVENGDYNGDYFSLLLRVCFVLNRKFDVGGPGMPLSPGSECNAVIV
jgi:ribosome-binding protein aMBF1 (putative translation factor)